MKIIFHGDRKSKTVRLGKMLRRLFPKLVLIDLWDGYKSRIFFREDQSDVHTRRAAEIFNVPYRAVTKEQRTVGKLDNYRRVYSRDSSSFVLDSLVGGAEFLYKLVQIIENRKAKVKWPKNSK